MKSLMHISNRCAFRKIANGNSTETDERRFICSVACFYKQDKLLGRQSVELIGEQLAAIAVAETQGQFGNREQGNARHRKPLPDDW
jgi:hypothetical protein